MAKANKKTLFENLTKISAWLRYCSECYDHILRSARTWPKAPEFDTNGGDKEDVQGDEVRESNPLHRSTG